MSSDRGTSPRSSAALFAGPRSPGAQEPAQEPSFARSSSTYAGAAQRTETPRDTVETAGRTKHHAAGAPSPSMQAVPVDHDTSSAST